jgi:type II secretory pathway component PulC
MRIHWKKYSWTLSLLVIVICSGLAARAFGLYLTTQIPDATVSTQARMQPTQQPGPQISRDITAIVSRNPFCSTCKPASIVNAPADQAGQLTTPFEVPANLALIVTLISDDPGWSFAAIRDTKDGRTGLHTVDSVVPGGARVKAIKDRHVVLEKDGQEGDLPLQSVNTQAPTARPRSRINRGARGGTPADIAAGIRQVKQGRFEIQRGALNKLLSNTAMVGRSGRITPHTKGGFTLSKLRQGGIYQLLGFQSGDNINAINGRAITSPDSVLPIYRNLRRASHVTISYSRRGKTSTHDYTIR